MTTDWMTGIRSPAEEQDFSCSLCVQNSSEAHQACYPVGTGGKAQPGHDTDHSSPSTFKVKNDSSPPWHLHGGSGTSSLFYFYCTFFHINIQNFYLLLPCTMISGSTVTMAWRVLRLRIEETASRYGG
jgi:hypothetical protein